MDYTITISGISNTASLNDDVEVLNELFKYINNKKISITTVNDKLLFVHNNMPANAIINHTLSTVYDEGTSEHNTISLAFRNVLNASWKKPESQEELVKRLATLTPIERDRALRDEAKKLSCKTTTLDKLVKDEVRGQIDREQAIIDYYCKTYSINNPKTIDLPDTTFSAVLGDIVTLLREYFFLSNEEDFTLIAYWILATWFSEKMPYAPILQISAPTFGCGKTELMKIVSLLSRRSIEISAGSVSNITKILGLCKPTTTFADESDVFINGNNTIRGIFDMGVLPTGCVSIQEENSELKCWLPVMYNVFGPKCLVGVGSLSRSLETRSIIIRMQNMPNSVVLKDTLEFTECNIAKGRINTLVEQMNYLASKHKDTLNTLVKIPATLKNRYKQVFRPSFILSEFAGAVWTEKLKKAINTSVKTDIAQQRIDFKTELLQDVYDIFVESACSELSTISLICSLIGDEEKVWKSYGKQSKSLDARAFAEFFKEFQDITVHSKNIRHNNVQTKGWIFSDIEKLYKTYNKRGE